MALVISVIEAFRPKLQADQVRTRNPVSMLPRGRRVDFRLLEFIEK